jgi:hypothetical protein
MAWTKNGSRKAENSKAMDVDCMMMSSLLQRNILQVLSAVRVPVCPVPGSAHQKERNKRWKK